MERNPAIWWSESRKFLREVWAEAHKVTFPTRKEAVAGTIGVIVIVTIITGVLGVIDFTLSQTMQLLVR